MRLCVIIISFVFLKVICFVSSVTAHARVHVQSSSLLLLLLGCKSCHIYIYIYHGHMVVAYTLYLIVKFIKL